MNPNAHTEQSSRYPQSMPYWYGGQFPVRKSLGFPSSFPTIACSKWLPTEKAGPGIRWRNFPESTPHERERTACRTRSLASNWYLLGHCVNTQTHTHKQLTHKSSHGVMTSWNFAVVSSWTLTNTLLLAVIPRTWKIPSLWGPEISFALNKHNNRKGTRVCLFASSTKSDSQYPRSLDHGVPLGSQI